MATGTTLTTYSDSEFLFRLQTLIIDGGTEVLRNIFNQRLQNQPLYVVLANEKTTVNQLRRQEIITRPQYDQMYPPSGQRPTSADFDITLISCLLRNLPSLGVKQNYKWHVPPQATDNSFEADLWRIRMFRNEIAHISSTKGFKQATFQTKWTEIEQVLLRLNLTSSNPLPNFYKTINEYKYSPIDPSAEHRIQTTIEQWREMEKGLESEILFIKEDVCETKKDFKKIMRDVEGTKQQVEIMKKGIGNKTPDSREEKDNAYKKLKSDIQNDLISFYKRQHRSIPLSPLMKEDQSLLKFYVMPDIQSITVSRSRNGDKEEKTTVRKLRDVFYKENKLCNNIYLTAHAGLGKTAFSKKLTLAWCHAKKPDKRENKHFSEDEIIAICGFSFVFLVPLRDNSGDCDIDMLILNQICSQLPRNYGMDSLRTILQKEICLVILDGLDEWTHPLERCKQGRSSIPHRRTRENIAVLTTTRPWELSESGLHSSQIDHKLELTGLNTYSAMTLKKAVISHLHGEQDKNKIDAYEMEFDRTVETKMQSDITAIPLFLMYLLLLWYYKFTIGKSLATLYSSLIELLLSRTVKKDGIEIPKAENIQGNIPPCFYGFELCTNFYTVLISLGKLAFKTLFSKTKENTLVFDGCVAEKYLNGNLAFCLSTGIITQSKVRGTSLLEVKSKVSFAHKTLQEFFAALYMNSKPDQMSIQAIVGSTCKCIKDIIDMSSILVFIVRISEEFTFSHELMKIINEDEITHEYRRSSRPCEDISSTVQYIQDVCISCYRDIPRENKDDACICLQDVTIDFFCSIEDYRENLKQLTTRNKHNIKSLYIDIDAMEHTPLNTARKVIDYFELCDMENIEKIMCIGECNDADILPFLSSSVKCLYLCGGWLPQSFWSPCVFNKVSNLQNIEALEIGNVTISQSELILLLDYISHRDCLREIGLMTLICTDYKPTCTGLSLDLSGHVSLRRLTLKNLGVSLVTVNMALLETCYLLDLFNQDLELTFLNGASSRLHTFEGGGLKSAPAIDAMLHTLHLLGHVRQVTLENLNLVTRSLTFSPDIMTLKKLTLDGVTMEISTFIKIVGSFLTLPQKVEVDLNGCIVSPREMFNRTKAIIKSLQHVKILRDIDYWFQFETVKGGY